MRRGSSLNLSPHYETGTVTPTCSVPAMMKPHRDVKRSACKGVPASYLLSHGRPPQKSEGETAGNTCQLTVGFHHCVGEVFAPCLTSGWSQAISWGCGLIRRLNRGRRVHPRGVPLTWLSA